VRPAYAAAAAALVVICLAIGVLVVVRPGQGTQDPTSTSVPLGELVATLRPSRTVDGATLRASASIITKRLHSAGYESASAAVVTDRLVVRASGSVDPKVLRVIARRGSLTFQPVVVEVPSSECGRFTEAVPGADPTVGCYVLDPVVLTGERVRTALASDEPTSGGWGVDIRFEHGAFAPVATQYVNRQVAMVVDGVVLSAPMINPGITGDVVRISGPLTSATAKGLAASLSVRPILPVSFHISGG
jgi:preprotein translocase subunit SecD